MARQLEERSSASSTLSEEDTPPPKTPKPAKKRKQDAVTQRQQQPRDVKSDDSDSGSAPTPLKKTKMEEFWKSSEEVTRRLGRKSFEETANFVLKRALHVVEGKRKTELEEKWKNLHVKEMELFLGQIQLVGYCTNLVLASYKGN